MECTYLVCEGWRFVVDVESRGHANLLRKVEYGL